VRESTAGRRRKTAGRRRKTAGRRRKTVDGPRQKVLAIGHRDVAELRSSTVDAMGHPEMLPVDNDPSRFAAGTADSRLLQEPT